MEDKVKKQIELFTNSDFSKDLRLILPGSIRKTTLIELTSPEERQNLEKCNDIYSKIFKDIYQQ